MKRVHFTVVLLFFLAVNSGFGQNVINNPYSRYGLGQMMYGGNGRGYSMGQTGFASYSQYYFTKLNPASYAAIPSQRVLFNFGIANRLSLYENQDSSLYTNESYVRSVAALIPVTKFLNISAGIAPYSSVGYLFPSSDSIYTDLSGANIITQYEGSGGLTEAYLGMSIKPLKNFVVASNLYTRWGTFTHTTTNIIDEPGFSTQTNYKDYYRLKGIAADVSVLFSDTIVNKEDRDVLAYVLTAKYTPETYLNGKEFYLVRKFTDYYANSFIDTLANDTLNTFKAKSAQGIDLGASFTLYKKLTLELNYSKYFWEGTTIFDNQTLKNSEKYAFGFEYCKDFSSTIFWRRIAWRGGAYYNSTYWNIGGTSVADYGFTFGVGLPTKSTIINLTFDFGTQGAAAEGFVKESYFLFSMDLTMLDFWFVKRKFL